MHYSAEQKKALDYWREREKAEPNAFCLEVLRALGFTEDEIEQIRRERYSERYLELCKKRNEDLARDLAQLPKLETEVTRLGIIIEQELVRLMRQWGYSDEEINEKLGASEAVRIHRRDFSVETGRHERSEEHIQSVG
jgi:hypothetical protein